MKHFRAVERAPQPSSTQKGHSAEDERALQISRKATKVNGHYYISILFRGEQTLPNNKPLAKKRLENLGMRPEKNHALKNAYLEVMQAMNENGHAEKVPKEQKAARISWTMVRIKSRGHE